MAHFKNCKNLSIVWLEGVPVTDAALAVFAGNTNLSTLLMGHTKVTDAGLAHLKDCTNLTSLSLLYLPVTDAGLAHVKDCKKLKDLDLRNTRVTDAGPAYFKDCKDLTTLWVWGTITNAGLAHFKDCKNLKGLDLSTTSVTDAELTILKEWTAVESLQLNGTKVSDAGLGHVKHCKALKRLDLQATKVSAAGIETLAKALPQCEIEWDGGRTSPDRRAAEYVLSIGGTVCVDGNLRRLSRLGWSGRVYELRMPAGIKDPADLHKESPENFLPALEQAIRSAKPLSIAGVAGMSPPRETDTAASLTVLQNPPHPRPLSPAKTTLPGMKCSDAGARGATGLDADETTQSKTGGPACSPLHRPARQPTLQAPGGRGRGDGGEGDATTTNAAPANTTLRSG